MEVQKDPKMVVVCALYKFVRFDNYVSFQPELLNFMKKNQVFGSLLLAKEGINGTVASSRKGIDNLLQFLNSNPILAPIDYKESFLPQIPFQKTKVKLKKEIVNMGVEDIDPNQVVGTYIEPQNWNQIISDPKTITIDTRNDYEYQIGTFKNAVNPKTHQFTEFPEYVKQNFDPKVHKKIAMFCTGGIRCEKSTAYMKQLGFEEVYHLKGGILKYLEEVPKEKSMWEGECFVFDERIAVDHDLQPGKTKQFYTGKPENYRPKNVQSQQEQEQQQKHDNDVIQQQQQKEEVKEEEEQKSEQKQENTQLPPQGLQTEIEVKQN